MKATDLVPFGQDMSLQETMTLGQTLAQSGYFSDARQAAQAVVKILAGRELGFGPIASMTGINIIQGQVSIGSNLMAAAAKRTGKYDYRVVDLSERRCEIAFFQNGEDIGHSSFSMEDAKQAELASKKNWRKWPRNMLFSRALSNGVRWYCPDVFGGAPVYTPEELGAPVDAEGNVIEATPTIAAPPEDTARSGPLPVMHPTSDNDKPKGNGKKAKNGKSNGRSWLAEVIQAVVPKYAENAANAVAMLNLSQKITEHDALDIILQWCEHYRGARSAGDNAQDAAKYADAKLELPEPEAEPV